MGIDKVILKAVLSTLAAIVLLLTVAVAALVFVYPSTLMEISYNVGLDDASAWFADRAYEQQKNIFYIGFATEVAIGKKDPEAEQIEKYGDKFIADEHFSDYCAEMDSKAISGVSSSYAQYVYGQLYVAKYKLGKTEEAVEGAFAVNTHSFARNNAVAAVLFAASQNADKPVLEEMIARMREIDETQKAKQTFPDEDVEYLEILIVQIEQRMEKLS